VNVYDPIARYYEADVAYYTDDIPFYREMAERAGDPILDAMCGAGRVLLPLASLGYRLVGVDSSQPMIDIARERVRSAGLTTQVELMHGDIRSIELPAAHFPLAFVAVNSFMHMERIKDQLAALAAIRRALVPDGVLLIDVFNPDPVALSRENGQLVFEREFELDGQRVCKFVSSDSNLTSQVSAMTYVFDTLDAENRVTRHIARFNLRWFYRYELEHLLARAGFRLLSCYGSYELEDYNSTSEQLIVLATPHRQQERKQNSTAYDDG
jgi:SAM-dependent methyltransferase